MISTPIKVARYYRNGDSRITNLIESEIVNNELLIETICRFDEERLIDISQLLDSNIDYSSDLNNLVNTIKSKLVYQEYLLSQSDPNKPDYDYYSYLNDGTKTISLVAEPTVIKVGLIFKDESGLPEYEISLDDELSDVCYKLVTISCSSYPDFNVVTQVHRTSNRPHINYFKDIMTDNDMVKVRNRYMYDSEVHDVRNNNLLGKNLSSKIWQ